jgi:Kef-type K+ transport system membrane component KefB
MADTYFFEPLFLIDNGYKSNLWALAENGGLAVLIFPLLIFAKKLADTTYCGPPFILFLRYLGIS